MKIGILTHHYVKNYGAFLQMKALYETLKNIYPNDEITIVNFVSQKHWRKNIIHILHYKLKYDSLITYQRKIRQLFIFTKYERSLPRTKKVRNAEAIRKLDLDLLVIGSDEVWNLHGYGHHLLKYGCGLNNMNIIAYSPSVGEVNEKSDVPIEIANGLKNIKKISGRDFETINFVKRLIGIDVEVMLDPTFLYNFDIDIKNEKIQPKDYKYILIYDCKLTDDMIQVLCQFAKERGLKILGAGDYKPFYDEITIDLTPYEWVSLFKNSEMVITGTFHGTVFSIKYDKNLLCYPTEPMRINKISSILKDMGLKERLIEVGNEDKLEKLLLSNTDYLNAHQYIEKKQKEAYAFLQGEGNNDREHQIV